MENTKEKICRLCLNAEGDFVNIDAIVIGKLKSVVPELALDSLSDAFACSKCIELLEKSLKFQETFSKTKEFIQKEKDKSNGEKIDLNNIIKAAEPNSNTKVCRICLERGTDFTIVETEKDDVLVTVLQKGLLEVDLDLTVQPVICDSCRDSFLETYNFKKDCIAFNERMQTDADDESDEKFDLSILNRTEDENDFLSGFEVQDEEGDIFVSNYQSEDNSKKRTADDSVKEPDVKKVKLSLDDTPKKKAEVEKIKIVRDVKVADNVVRDDGVKEAKKNVKPEPVEVTDEELPPFSFNANMLHNLNKVDCMLEDWLEIVERHKKKYGWSDIATIHKVLANLKDMQELYVWFSNIANIMDWAQWKKKLLRAFPGRDDFHLNLKRILLRKKRWDETYVSYYHSKMECMEPLNLTDEQKVSCIFGGMVDVLACCVGRVGGYETPEEVLEYLKSCDEKQALEAGAGGEKSSPKPKVPQQQAAKAAPKKKKCFVCQKPGHTANECRHAARAARGEAPKAHNSPKPNQAMGPNSFQGGPPHGGSGSTSEESSEETSTPDTVASASQDPTELPLLTPVAGALRTKVGPDVHVELAVRWEACLTNRIPPEAPKFLKKYKVPGNCLAFRAPKLNKEVKSLISRQATKNDQFFANLQYYVGTGLTALTRIINRKLKDPEDPMALTWGYLQAVEDAAHILACVHQALSLKRRCDILQYLNKGSKKTKAANVQRIVDGFLFESTYAENLYSVHMTKMKTAAQQKRKWTAPGYSAAKQGNPVHYNPRRSNSEYHGPTHRY